MLFWGPTGTGKTTLARLIAHYWGAEFLTLSASTAGQGYSCGGGGGGTEPPDLWQATVLLLMKCIVSARHNRDAFLPHIESGVLIFIGATTENPSLN
ncbi:MAG: AAA family ATPase [Thiolinea sp.]